MFWPFKRLQVVAASGQHARCEKFQSTTKPVYARQAARLYDRSKAVGNPCSINSDSLEKRSNISEHALSSKG